MRSTLWSRAARPKLNGPCTSTSTSVPYRSSVIRKTASGPIQRQITVNDVFTLLLTPILATALLADTTWKDKRRKDWAHKIAEIEAETQQIHSQATQSWQALQSRSHRHGPVQQRRQYSVAALRSQSEDEGNIIQDQPAFSNHHLPVEDLENEPAWFEATSKKVQDHIEGHCDVQEQDLVRFTPQDLEKSEHLRRLLAVKLALNLTIYLNTGVSPSKVRKEIRIPDITPDLRYDPHGNQDLPRLLRQMRGLCSTIEDLQQSLPNGASPVRPDILDPNSQQLQDDICALSERYQTSSITMPEFVTSYTLAVLKSPFPPTSKAYLGLFRGFARGSSGEGTSHDLAMQTLFAWEQSKLPIDDHDLFVILTELARCKHVQKFDALMRDLTMSPSPLNVTSKWTWEQANEIQVPVPKSHHPALLTTLIHCALRFDQPQKAEAWSEILRKSWIDVNDPTQKTPLQQFFTNWMRYYEVQGNWRRGVAWLDAAQKWAITVASFDMYSLQRLAIGMLSLCLACGKSREYEEILNAAIDSGIPSMNPRHFLKRSSRRAICKEWNHLHYETYRYRHDTRTAHEKVKNFQDKVKAVTQRLLPEKDGADIEWRREQEHVPNPLVARPVSASADHNPAQAIALWQQISTKNQEALNDMTTAAKKWQVQCTLQQKQMRSLESELEYQRKLVRELKGIRTKTPSIPESENEKGELYESDDSLPTQLPKPAQSKTVHQESDVVKISVVQSPLPEDTRNAGIVTTSENNTYGLHAPHHGTVPRKREPILVNHFLQSHSQRTLPALFEDMKGNLSEDDYLLSHLIKA